MAIKSYSRHASRAALLILLATASIVLQTFHIFAQHRWSPEDGRLDGLCTSVIQRLASGSALGVSSASSTPDRAGNDGSISTKWNERWAENWSKGVDLLGRPESRSRKQWTTTKPTEGPIRGVVSLDQRAKLQTARNIRDLMVTYQAMWPVAEDRPGRNATVNKLERLATCLEQNTCKRGETTVVIGGSLHFSAVLFGDRVSGEDMWAKSVIEAVEGDLGHTLLYADFALEAATLYQGIPHLVSNVIMEADQVHRCATLGIPEIISERELEPQENQGVQVSFEEVKAIRLDLDLPAPSEEDADKIWGWRGAFGSAMLEERGEPLGCIKRMGFEQGIPAWKTFSFNFWSSTDHPLGRAWTLAPEDYGNHPGHKDDLGSNFYLGYTIERACKQIQAVPRGEREQRAYILAKETWYFDEDKNVFWAANNTFEYLTVRTGLPFISMAGQPGDVLADTGVKTLGRKPRADFLREVSHSVAMVGIGQPPLSPTPYEGLCLGVPFINPVVDWDGKDPDDRDRWYTQHNGLVELSAPQVYHVRAHDIEGLRQAVEAARQTPIDSFVPERMTAKAMQERVQTLINLDWKALFQHRMAMADWDAMNSALLL